MGSEKDFLRMKEQTLKKLENAYTEDKVDTSIYSILELLNALPSYYTSSSCAGRIMLIELPTIGDKRGAEILGKWHSPVQFQELKHAAKKAKKGIVWMLAQSPIFHIGAQTLNAADTLVKLAISCGFKNSGIRSIGEKIIIEICSTERLDTPIGRDGILHCDDTYLQLLGEIANDIMQKSMKKLQRFETKLRNI